MKNNVPRSVKLVASDKRNNEKQMVINRIYTSYLREKIDVLPLSNTKKVEIYDRLIKRYN